MDAAAPGVDLTADRIAAVDTSGQLAVAATLCDQLRAGWATAWSALQEETLPGAAGSSVTGVAVVGMGGSAIGADVVGACLGALPVPYAVVRGYELPAWVGPQTLTIAVSYSGNTEETLACVDQALARGCRPVCVATGGALGGVAAGRALPLVTVTGGLQPRASLGYLVTAIGAALERAGLTGVFGEQVAEAAVVVQARALELAPGADDEADEGANEAKRLAGALLGKIPVVYGAGLTAPAARRWKGQLNENAKVPAFFNELPELDHNELVGFGEGAAPADSFFVVALDDDQADERLRRRMDYTLEIVAARAGGVARVDARGATPLARLLSTIVVGDFASLYLAVLRGVDPAPVAAIEGLKARLGGAPPGS